jgi:hypothetical protein
LSVALALLRWTSLVVVRGDHRGGLAIDDHLEVVFETTGRQKIIPAYAPHLYG